METYAVPRPINYRNGYENRDEVPRYLNVGRSVETELQYVAMQEEEEKRERDAGSSMAAADGNTHRAVGQGKKSGNVKTSSRRRTGWLWVIVSVQGVTFLLAFSALVLGAMSVGKLRGTTPIICLIVNVNPSYFFALAVIVSIPMTGRTSSGTMKDLA